MVFVFVFVFVLTEPGYYKTNDFGIRIEDIAVTVPAQTKVKKDVYSGLSPSEGSIVIVPITLLAALIICC